MSNKASFPFSIKEQNENKNNNSNNNQPHQQTTNSQQPTSFSNFHCLVSLCPSAVTLLPLLGVCVLLLCLRPLLVLSSCACLDFSCIWIDGQCDWSCTPLHIVRTVFYIYLVFSGLPTTSSMRGAMRRNRKNKCRGAVVCHPREEREVRYNTR